ncbi:excinuclease ABC subunit UvrC [Candidatus Saccharibacteria bacterium]|nr:MAG: excinuclease ABC subunit UvrC [Candidatus Saccharibacteria bacterium]
MNEILAKKLKDLPKEPGVYFHKDAKGEIIYVGKAAILRNRVRQYFQKSRLRDPKTDLLVSEIVDTDWQVVESEFDALFLEAEMIRRYMPRYNILLRDDKSQTFVRIDFKSQYPTVTMTRRPLDDGANYYGPFLSTIAVRRALKYLRKVFPYSTHTVMPKRACLLAHLHLCPGPETGELDEKDYKTNLKKLVRVLQGQKGSIIREIEKDMQAASAAHNFELAAKRRNQITALKDLDRRVLFSDKEFLDLSKDHALIELTEVLGLAKVPKRIEGYDISHMSGTDVVASMVVFTNGAADKANYRKFKSHKQNNDDFEHMRETMTRRFSEKNIKQWGMPELVLIDGGKGQLEAALSVIREKELKLPVIGIAKKHEEIVIRNDWPNTDLQPQVVTRLRGILRESDDFTLVDLPNSSNVIKLLQRIRDESHRFAVSYHSVLKVKRQTASILDDVPGIGPATRKKLIRTFGSLRGVQQARRDELEQILGPVKATVLRQYLRAANKEQDKTS